MPDRSKGQIRVILHATDFSPASGPAFAKAVELARANRAALLLAHVVSPVVIGEGYVSSELYAEISASGRAYAAKELAALVARAKKAGVAARPVLLEGIAHEQIARAARSRRADMIVIGTHGRTGLVKLFLGSVASRVISSARCPVMTVRGTSRPTRAAANLAMAALLAGGLLAGAPAAAQAPKDAAAEGARLFQVHGCYGCHTIGKMGTPIAPDLSKVGTKHDTAYFVSWIKDPSSQRETAHMPAIKMTDAEAQALAAFLSSQR